MFNKFSIILWLCVFSSHLNEINSYDTDNPPNNSVCMNTQKNACHMTQYAPNSESNVFERSLVLIKPDAVQRKLVGKIIERFENKGLKLVAMKLFLATREMAEEHYIEHQDRAFFEKLMDYMTSHPLIPMVWEGPNSIKIIRNMLGVHDPTLALAGTIRGDFSVNLQNNVIHGSDSIDAAKREINIWFQPNEIPY